MTLRLGSWQHLDGYYMESYSMTAAELKQSVEWQEDQGISSVGYNQNALTG